MLAFRHVLRERQEVVTRKMSAEELQTGRSRCADDDMQTREMAAIERDELLRIEARERPPRPRRRRPTMRTQRLRISMIALVRPRAPKTFFGILTASLVICAVVAVRVLRA